MPKLFKVRGKVEVTAYVSASDEHEAEDKFNDMYVNDMDHGDLEIIDMEVEEEDEDHKRFDY